MIPKYNPLAMGNLTYAKNYGKKMKRHFDKVNAKILKENRNRLCKK